jgi:hypothetical protein
MATEIGTLVIDLKAQVARLEKDMKRSADSVKKSADQIESAAGFAKKALLALASVIGLNQLKNLVANSFAAVDAVAKLSDRLGIATESMAGLQHAADLAGVSGQTLNTGLRTMLKNVGEAAQGFGVATRAFDVLGLSAQKLSALAPDLQLQKILDTLAGVENVTLRNATASQIFGVRASEMLNLIADGAGGVRRATEDTIAWGKALDRVDSAKIEAANDAVDRARTAFEGFFNRVAVHLAPFITFIATGFADAAKESKGFADETTSGMEKVTLAVAYSANAVRGLQVTYAGLKVAIAEVLDFTIQTFVQTQDFFDKLPIFRTARVLSEKLHGLSTQQAVNLEELVTVSANRLEELKTEFDMLLLEPLPADAVIAWFAKVKAEAQKAAEETAAARKKLFGAGGEIVEPRKRDDKDRDDFFKYEEGLNKKLAALDLYLMTDAEKNDAAFAQRSETLQELYSLDLLNQQEFLDRSAALSESHAQRRLDLERKVSEGIVSMQHNTWSLAGGLLQAFAGKSRAAAIAVIAISKGLAIAQTIAATSAAIMRAYADLGPIAGSGAAARIAALGKIQVGLIAATGLAEAAQVGRGGADLGTPANPVNTAPGVIGQPAAAPGRTTVIHVELVGDYFDRKLIVEKLMPLFNEYTMDGGRVELVPR